MPTNQIFSLLLSFAYFVHLSHFRTICYLRLLALSFLSLDYSLRGAANGQAKCEGQSAALVRRTPTTTLLRAKQLRRERQPLRQTAQRGRGTRLPGTTQPGLRHEEWSVSITSFRK